MYRRIERCRVCKSDYLIQILDLGEQALTGVFPKTRDEPLTVGPLRLVKCHGVDACGLVQLEHSYVFEEMYGANYGYRSGLNKSMADHLQGKIDIIRRRFLLRPGEVVVDIGSNDGTTLAAYPPSLRRIGIDPTADKFRSYYEPGIEIVAEQFTEAAFRSVCADRQASVVTTFAMLYDLEDPLAFMRDVHRVLADDGVWVSEQSYLPLMMKQNAYDTVMHEHFEYYSLAVLQRMAQVTGFKIIDVEINDTNGGSSSITIVKVGSKYHVSPNVQAMLDRERDEGFDGLAVYAGFAKRVRAHYHELRAFVADARAAGKTVGALGASTKGNTVLQYCGFGPEDIYAIGEVNEDKVGGFTPRTWIPIVSESDVIAAELDYLIVLPWHFRSTFMRLLPKLRGSTRLVFPLPKLEVVER